MAGSLRIQWGLLYRGLSRRDTGAVQPGTTSPTMRFTTYHNSTPFGGGKTVRQLSGSKAIVIALH